MRVCVFKYVLIQFNFLKLLAIGIEMSMFGVSIGGSDRAAEYPK